MRLLSVIAALFVCASAAAQTPPANPVIQHYRAYQAALQNNDLPTAENEAEWALASSQQRDGDGGRTAILALNLANVRLALSDAAGALEPARQALRLAQAGASGLDARLAGLTLGRAELSTAGRPGADRLSALLNGSLENIPTPAVYSAASELGVWALGARDFELSQSAWRRAGESADGAPQGRDFGLATARTGEGAAIVLDEIGANGSQSLHREQAMRADALFREASAALGPLFFAERLRDPSTPAVRSYAEALAWRAIIAVKLLSDGRAALPPPDDEDTESSAQVSAPADSQCAVRTVRGPIEYPDAALDNFQVGVVTVLLRFNESGAVLGHSIVASLGNRAFAHVIDREAAHWRVTRLPNAAPGCQMRGATLVTVRFVMRA